MHLAVLPEGEVLDIRGDFLCQWSKVMVRCPLSHATTKVVCLFSCNSSETPEGSA